MDNMMSNLNLTGCSSLEGLTCCQNSLDADALNELFNTLPDNSSVPTKVVSIAENDGTDTCNRDIALTRGWTVNDTIWRY